MIEIEEYRNNFYESLLLLDRPKISEIFEDFLSQHEEGSGIIDAIEDIIIPSMEKVGKGWENDTLSLSQVYMIGRLCEDLVDKFLPGSSPGRKNEPKLAICVFEDYHLLGKRLVYSALRANGFKILDYGHGLGVEEIEERVARDKPDVLLMATLMLSSALHIKDLKSRLPKGSPKLLVGGAPFLFDPDLWKEVGADAMGSNATEAIELVKKVTAKGI
ncbi:MAG: cobalamin B12-binding domain-containing protein [Actinomycetota bacterium]